MFLKIFWGVLLPVFPPGCRTGQCWANAAVHVSRERSCFCLRSRRKIVSREHHEISSKNTTKISPSRNFINKCARNSKKRRVIKKRKLNGHAFRLNQPHSLKIRSSPNSGVRIQSERAFQISQNLLCVVRYVLESGEFEQLAQNVQDGAEESAESIIRVEVEASLCRGVNMNKMSVVEKKYQWLRSFKQKAKARFIARRPRRRRQSLSVGWRHNRKFRTL